MASNFGTANVALEGVKTAEQSTTIKASKWAQIVVVLGTLGTMALQYLPQVQELVLGFVPPVYQPLVVAGFQVLTALLAVFFGNKVIDGRVNATKRIVVTKQ